MEANAMETCILSFDQQGPLHTTRAAHMLALSSSETHTGSSRWCSTQFLSFETSISKAMVGVGTNPIIFINSQRNEQVETQTQTARTATNLEDKN